MRAEDRALARKNLDRRLNSIRTAIPMDRPPRGWVKAIREALGMTAAQLASRIRVTRPRVYEIEKSEVSGSITLDSLERAARALNCQLVYAFVPRKSLEELTQEQALRVAEKKIRKTAHSMALEDQTVDQRDELEQIQVLAKRLVEKSVTKLWAEE